MKKRFALALAAALCLTMLASTAYAADTTLDITYVPITEDGFVADTMTAWMRSTTAPAGRIAPILWRDTMQRSTV